MYATLDGLEFRGDAEPTTYTIARMPGWWGTDFRHEQVARPTAAGDFDAPVFQSGRIITLEGLVLATSTSAFESACDALENLLADGSADTLTVYQESATYTLEVRRHGGLNLDITVYGRTARYQIQLWAPDPEKVLVP